jgi:DNA-binding Lrp family transcriptional regulator
MKKGHKNKGIQKYFDLYMLVVDNPRMKVRKMAKKLEETGRGRTFSAIAKRLRKMYQSKISFTPKLVLRPFENVYSTAYFCRKSNRDKIRQTFVSLKNDKSIDYCLFLAGDFDFFLVSKERDIHVEQYGLEIVEKHILYTTIYTIPKGWERPIVETYHRFSKFDFEKGQLERKMESILKWSHIDWRIYYSMRENARAQFASIGKKLDVAGYTVKSHFFKYVLPNCSVAHYFFPKGYDLYKQAFMKITTHYEKSLVEALRELPCTTYVLPLDKGLVVNIFHEGVNELMTALQEIEEIGVLKTYSLHVPLTYRLKESFTP